MEGEAIKRIEDLAHAASTPREIDGRHFAPVNHIEIKPKPDPLADTLIVHTLAAFRDFLHDHAPHVDGTFVHVEGPTRISLVGPLDKHQRREVFVSASYEAPRLSCIGNWTMLEDFLIQIQSGFTDSGDADRLFGLLGNMSNDEQAKQEDDGITQRIIVKRGVTSLGEERIANPFHLAPFATFPEATQVDRTFVLRTRNGTKGIDACLFPADGNAWKLAAVEVLRIWLEEQLEATNASGLSIYA